MSKSKTNTQRTGPRPTPRPGAQRHLEAADKRQANERADKKTRTAAYVIGAAGLLSLGVGLGGRALEAGKDYSQAQTEKLAHASAKAGEICVIEAVGGTINDTSAIALADKFGDGTRSIQRLSEGVTAVLIEEEADAGEDGKSEGVGFCRPKNSTDLNDNNVVAPSSIQAGQLVTIEQYADAGGVSEDIG